MICDEPALLLHASFLASSAIHRARKKKNTCWFCVPCCVLFCQYRVDGIAGDGEDSDDGSAKKRRRASKSLPDCEAAWEDEDDAALK